eukprot:NODE_13890_length_1140_cov_17.876604.p1 GENE.NODE_13890_length_1140_cov_17.876604~~NODE_13890_length_1140_cov_17.876604.p1  ORF type:complete len:235 (-),score=50.97 NODE_13890_length_1140_cov_17.876604:314-1018(-)
MAFAAQLTRAVAVNHKERQGRHALVERWLKHEENIIDECLEVFKKQCLLAAEREQCELVVSFEVLTREVPLFPTRFLLQNTWYVESWVSGEITTECWLYGTKGLNALNVPGQPAMFCEVLAGIFTKFLDKLAPLGFLSCERESGTYKFRVTWQAPNGAASPAAEESPVAASSPELEKFVQPKEHGKASDEAASKKAPRRRRGSRSRTSPSPASGAREVSCPRKHRKSGNNQGIP